MNSMYSLRVPHLFPPLVLCLCVVLCVLLTPPDVAHAQPPDTITANPKAQALRPVWMLHGTGNEQVGYGIGSVSDINGDSISDFAVYLGGKNEWRIYYGSRDGISMEPAVVIDSIGALPPHPIVGNFWGDERKAIGFTRGYAHTVNGSTSYYLLFLLFRVGPNGIDTKPAAILDTRIMSPATLIYPSELIGSDLDGDGYDELIVYNAGVTRNEVVSRYPEVWIYRGGPNFQVDSPTIILRDTEINGGRGLQSLFVGHWDNDGKLDIATSSDYDNGSSQKFKLWSSTKGSPWSWTTPSREIRFSRLMAFDGDGDAMLDIAIPLPDGRVGVYLSGSGKSIHDRPLTLDDVDVTYYRNGYSNIARLGYISDSAKRYEMLAIFGGPGPTFLGFSGGVGGPDHEFDLFSGDRNFALLEPIDDVTGDGWNDLMGSYYQENFDAGVAKVYAGGPYIPRDPSSSVRIVAGERRDAITLWPNPLRDELHIAWRGDLSQMPQRFQVHDVLGRLVARGEVESWRGGALWQCGNAAAGTYLVSIFDGQGSLIATATVVKQ